MIKILLLLLFIATNSIAQNVSENKTPANWQLMDWKQDGYPGISLEKAYTELLKNKKPSKKIIVAIIDSGIDDKQPDLAGTLWINKKEIPANGIDDDHNGYVDDVHGWNFVGNAKDETFESVREYVRLRGKFENRNDTLQLINEPEYIYWKKVLKEKDRNTGDRLQKFIKNLQTLQEYWNKQLKTDSIYIGDIKKKRPSKDADPSVIKADSFCMTMISHSEIPDAMSIISLKSGLQQSIDERYNLKIVNTLIEKNDPGYFRKKELGDDPYKNDIRNYGNNVTTPLGDFAHGTQCAGIVGAIRNNGLGGNGISNSVEIMPIIITHGMTRDEWDKDVSNAIRYAADNGAQVINMSFGKYLSPQKAWVEDAMKYAEHKGVLLIAGAGNDAMDVDISLNYPFAYSPKEIISNLIKVGASTYDSSLVGSFSNYGLQSILVFAPGVDIFTTGLHDTYYFNFGTSFATPMVAGLACLIWSYYPRLSYKQVKYCIEKSATPIQLLVTKPGTKNKVPFSSLSKSGGIVNAYGAMKLAEEMIKKK